MAVLLDHGTATGRVDGNGRRAAGLEGNDVALGEFAGSCQITRVRMERAATVLTTGGVHVVAVVIQHARRRLVHMTEQATHHAAGEAGDW